MNRKRKKHKKRRKPGKIRNPVNIDTLLADASMHHRQGNLPQARQLFEQALAIRPGWPPLLNALGTVLMDMGDMEGAASRFEQATPETAPYPPALYNMARLFQVNGDVSSAIRYCMAAVEADPGMAMAWNNLGLLFTDTGEPLKGVECFQKALNLVPDSPEVWNNMGLAREDAERPDDAAMAFRKALELRSDHVPALFNLGALELRLENRQEASGLLQKVLELDPGNQSACFLLQSLGVLPVPDAAPVDHVKKVFDQCALKFENTLVKKLEYRTPAALYQLAKPLLDQDMSILDLGCGTGLGADYYRPHARKLAGIDASEKMLELARSKGLYDRLFCRDILAPWDIENMRFDLIYSSDVFVYFGRLDFVLSEINRHLVPGGILAFSVERLSASATPFVLQENGRFAHSPDYVQEQLDSAGFLLKETEETVLRKEGGKDVNGLLIIAEKHEGAS